jgi:hypothetical protein
MAAEKAAKGELAALDAAVFLYCLNGITRTGWVIAAMVTQPWAEQ